MTQERLKEILENHKKWLNGEVSGVKANLSSANLTDVNLKYANLEGANLSSVNLSGANLSKANFRYVNLSKADFSSANLIYANLEGANLNKADLRYANLTGAKLRGAKLRGANLEGANLRGAIGNNEEVKTLQLGKYITTILVGIRIYIGCQNHTVEQWENFTDEEISKMDIGALKWWKEWKEFILKVAKENK